MSAMTRRTRRHRQSEPGRSASRRPWRLVTAGLTGVAVVLTGVAVTRGDGYTPTRFTVTASSAWLPSFKVGQVALVDGTTSDTLAKVDIVKAAARLAVVQSGSTAFVLNRDSGQLTRVDGGTLDTVNATPFPDSTSLQPFAGGGSLFVYDRDRGALATLDPTTLSVRRRTALAPAANEYSAAVDATGNLWVIAGNDGTVNRYDATGERVTRSRVSQAAKAQITLVRGVPVVIDLSGTAAVRSVDREDGRFTDSTCIPGAGHRLWPTGSPTRDRVYYSDGTAGALLVSDLDRGECDTFVDVAAPGSRLGPPLEVADKVLIPNWTASQVAIVDTRTWKVDRVTVPVPKENPFDLVSNAGFVFYNDPNSEQAGVISLDGRISPTRKYDPTDARGDLKGYRRPTPSNAVTPTKNITPTASPTDTRDRPTATPSDGQATAGAAQAQKLQMYVDPPPSPELGKPYSFQVRPVGPRHIATVSWTFGDGKQGAGLTVSHTFTTARKYIVTATATFTDGTTASTDAEIVVHAAPVVQIVSMRPGTADENVPQKFSATYRNGVPKSYLWTVYYPSPHSGETMATSTAAQPTFTFTQPTPDAGAPFRVTLVVDGNYSEALSLDVVVGPARPSGVSVNCTPNNPIAGQQIACSATANGYVTQWEWTLYTPDGSTTTLRESPTFVLPSSNEGAYRVVVVAINRTGRSEPGQTEFDAGRTSLKDISCSPSPAYVGVPVTCYAEFLGGSESFSDPTWQFVDSSGGVVANGALYKFWYYMYGDFSLTFPAAGQYQARFTFNDDFGNPQTLVSGKIAVAPAQHTVTVIAPAGAAISLPDRVCDGGKDGNTCKWQLGEGDKIDLRVAVDEDQYQITGWTGPCSGITIPRCSFTVGKDETVELQTVRMLKFTVNLNAEADCVSGGNGAGAGGSAAGAGPKAGTVVNAAWRGDDPTATETTTKAATTKPTTTTDKPTDKPTTTTSSDKPTTSAPDDTTTPPKPACKITEPHRVKFNDGTEHKCEIPAGSDATATCSFQLPPGRSLNLWIEGGGNSGVDWVPGWACKTRDPGHCSLPSLTGNVNLGVTWRKG